jgi:hypothetical protein
MAVRECGRCGKQQGTSPLSIQVASLCEHWKLHNASVCHHVCLHVCDYSMDVKLEQTANFKFCVKLGKSGAETFEIIRRAYGNDATSLATCFE